MGDVLLVGIGVEIHGRDNESNPGCEGAEHQYSADCKALDKDVDSIEAVVEDHAKGARGLCLSCLLPVHVVQGLKN